MNQMHFASIISDLKRPAFTASTAQWRSFTVFAQGPAVVLQWGLVEPDETGIFTIHHSRDGVSWSKIASIRARNTNQNVAQYRFIHNTVQPGNNLYQISLKGRGEEPSWSEARKVNLEMDMRAYSVESNVVSDCLIKVRIKKPVTLQIRTAEGALVHSSRYAPGLQIIEVPRSAVGVCWLDADGHVEKLLVH